MHLERKYIVRALRESALRESWLYYVYTKHIAQKMTAYIGIEKVSNFFLEHYFLLKTLGTLGTNIEEYNQ